MAVAVAISQMAKGTLSLPNELVMLRVSKVRLTMLMRTIGSNVMTASWLTHFLQLGVGVVCWGVMKLS